jgi:hypothetical protein
MKTLLMFVAAAFMSSGSNTTPNPGASSGSNKPTSEIVVTKDVIVQTPSGEVTLRAGTAVVVEAVQTYSGKNLSEGQTINVRVKYNVVVNKMTVIAAGSLGNATITDIQRPGVFGKAGRMELQVQSVQSVDGQQILVSGINMIAEGQNRKGLAWSLSIGLFILTLVGGAVGFLIKGKPAELKSGTTANVSVASDAQIDTEEK